MPRDSFHPLRLLSALGASPRDRLNVLEPVVEQWFVEEFRTHDDPPLDLESVTPARSRSQSREPVEEAVSWTIGPNSGRSIPDLEQ